MVDLPASDELEVSIFGPGRGESIVLHLGSGRWIVVDSCVDQQNQSVSALDYLTKIGVDVANDVRMIVATHAHDDHFAGISSIFEACTSAVFVISDALVNEDFLAMAKADAKSSAGLRASAYSEFRAIFKTAEKRRNYTTGFRPLRHASESDLLLTLQAVGALPEVRVSALSPSEHAKTRALQILADNFIKAQTSRSKLSRLNPNEASIALWIEAGATNVLLGADLLKGPRGCGWHAVVNTFDPPSPASLYKVAHHGAESSHHQEAWDKLLTDNPLAVLAPFRNGDIDLPKPSDVTRILSLTNQAFSTAAGVPTPSRAFKAQAAKLGSLAMNVRQVWGRVGHVRARCSMGSNDWTVDTFPPAGPLH